jgi:hypothetical protein
MGIPLFTSNFFRMWWPETLPHWHVNPVFVGEMRFHGDCRTPKSTPILPRLPLEIPLHADLGGYLPKSPNFGRLQRRSPRFGFWIRLNRTSDLFRVNLHLTFSFINLNAHGMPPKHLYLRSSRLDVGSILG